MFRLYKKSLFWIGSFRFFDGPTEFRFDSKCEPLKLEKFLILQDVLKGFVFWFELKVNSLSS
jgi:hypothetical protein